MPLAGELNSLTDEERRQVAAGFNEILESLGWPRQDLNDWWNLTAFAELGGRTPTRAWLDGDYDAVRQLVTALYAASSGAGERLTRSRTLEQLIAERSKGVRQDVALGDTSAFNAWINRSDPSYLIGSLVESWIRGLDDISWQAPSVPWSEDPKYRIATVPGSGGIIVFYSVEINEPDYVELVWVGNESEAEHLLG